MDIMIVDDNCLDSKVVQKYLLEFSIRHDYDFKTRIFASGEELIEYYKTLEMSPFLIIMDIEMGKMDGMTAAKTLRRLGYRGELVFLTCHESFVWDSFDVGASQYLVKPVSYDRFEEKIQPLVHRVREPGTFLFVELIQGGNQVIAIDEICAVTISEMKRYTLVLDMLKSELHINGIMKEYISKLTPKQFFLCHRKNLINLKQVKGIYGDQVLMSNGSQYLISRYKKKELKERLLNMAVLKI